MKQSCSVFKSSFSWCLGSHRLCSCGHSGRLGGHWCGCGRKMLGNCYASGRFDVPTWLRCIIQIRPRDKVSYAFVACFCEAFNFLTCENTIPKINLSHEELVKRLWRSHLELPQPSSYEIVINSVRISLSVKINWPNSCLAWPQDTNLVPFRIL